MTRAQIYFQEHGRRYKPLEKIITEKTISIYIHGDGYPFHEGVCSGIYYPLFNISRAFLKSRGYFDDEYLIARVLQHMANLRDIENPERKEFLGIGITTEECDVNYIYLVSKTLVECFTSDNLTTPIKSLQLS